MIIPLCLKIIRSCLVYCVHIWDRVQERCWSKCCVKSLRWVGFQALAQWGEADGTELIQPGEGMALRGTISSPHFQYLRRSYKVGEARLSIELHSGEKTVAIHRSNWNSIHTIVFLLCFVYLVGWFCSMKNIKHWNRLLLWSLCLEVSKTQKTQSDSVPTLISMLWAGASFRHPLR